MCLCQMAQMKRTRRKMKTVSFSQPVQRKTKHAPRIEVRTMTKSISVISGRRKAFPWRQARSLRLRTGHFDRSTTCLTSCAARRLSLAFSSGRTVTHGTAPYRTHQHWQRRLHYIIIVDLNSSCGAAVYVPRSTVCTCRPK